MREISRESPARNRQRDQCGVVRGAGFKRGTAVLDGRSLKKRFDGAELAWSRVSRRLRRGCKAAGELYRSVARTGSGEAEDGATSSVQLAKDGSRRIFSGCESGDVCWPVFSSLADYQDERYASEYLDRLEAIARVDRDGELLTETARYLALWMSYEDTIRVADLKTRGVRFERVRDEVHAQCEDSQRVNLQIREFLHPRVQEISDTLRRRVSGDFGFARNRVERAGKLRRSGSRPRPQSGTRTTSLSRVPDAVFYRRACVVFLA